MSITSGTVIHAPKGFHELATGATYFFLRSSPQTKIVTLLEFVERPAKVVVGESKKDEGGEDGIVTNGNGEVYWEDGNIDVNPLFVDNTDFHLQDSSPCIGVGIDSVLIDTVWYYTPTTDIEGNPD